jgi:transcriptional regulator with XRE-family HTH domain
MDMTYLEGASDWLTDLWCTFGIEDAVLGPEFQAGGTGGFEEWRQWRGPSTGNAGFMVEVIVDEVLTTRSPAEDILRIQEVFKPAVTELAAMFGVSRQTIYNWRNGEMPKPEQIVRLQNFVMAADIISTVNLPDRGHLLTRPLANGRCLADVIRSGEPAVEFARQLIHVARVERTNRERLNARFRSRARRPEQMIFIAPKEDGETQG